MTVRVDKGRVVFVLECLGLPRKVLRTRYAWWLELHHDVGEAIDPSSGQRKYYEASPYKTVQLIIGGHVYRLSESRVQMGKTPRGRTLYRITEVPSELVWEARSRSFGKALVG